MPNYRTSLRENYPNHPVVIAMTLDDALAIFGNLSIDVAGNVELSICVADDGVGMGQSSSAGSASEGLALHMMAVIGGTLIAEPAGERGTRVIVTLLVGQGTR